MKQKSILREARQIQVMFVETGVVSEVLIYRTRKNGEVKTAYPIGFVPPAGLQIIVPKGLGRPKVTYTEFAVAV